MATISIDGNIGCCKSTILNYLHKHHKISIDLEPIDKWYPYLLNLYEHKSNVFNFYIRIWLDRCWIQEKVENNNIVIERSPFFIKNCFIKKSLELSMITKDEYNILIELYNKTDFLWKNNIHIYLKSDPKSCYQRIKKRNRQCEENITEEYVTLIHNSHEEQYKKAVSDGKINIKIIDVENLSIEEISKEILNIIYN
jgi:deoxyadenosine/deoxycytidine kinase